jgi:type II secretory pathway predicted ATPase ExeA
MYESFYKFRVRPFTLVPDPDFLYRGETHRLALTTLEYGILNQAGFVVLSGEPGMGKTTLIQQILAEHREHFTTGLITNTHGDMDSLLPWILLAFGLSDKAQGKLESFHAFTQFLAKEGQANRRVLLIVDEAQNLGVELLEELRLLSNTNQDKAPVLQIILSGQPDLRMLLQRKDLTQFAQRVMVDYSLEPFNEADTLGYISHRIRVAGREDPLFTYQAGTMVHRLSGGIPRLINQLCDTALTYGFAEQAPHISAKLVSQAAKDRSKSGILPLSDRDFTMTKEQNEAEQEQLATFSTRMNHSTTTEPSKMQPTPPQEPNTPARLEVAELYEQGLTLKKVGRYKEALHQFSLASQDAAFSCRAMTQAGMCLKSAGKPTEAVAAFRKALQAQDMSPAETIQVRYLLARTLESLGRMDETLEAYRWIRRENSGFKDVAERIERLSSGKAQPLKKTGSAENTGSWLEQLQRIIGTFR